MFKSLELFQTASSMAQHAATRQSVVARNIANADTPNYHAKDIPDFKDVLANQPSLMMAKTRAGHLSEASSSNGYRVMRDDSAELSPNGNSVGIEGEMLKAIDAERQHARALAIYQHTLSVLKTSIGRGR